MTHNQIPSKRNQIGYQDSDAKFVPPCDCANLTADSVQNTSQHEKAKEMVTTIVRITGYAFMSYFSFLSITARFQPFGWPGDASADRWPN